MYLRPDIEEEMVQIGAMQYNISCDKLLDGAAEGVIQSICRYYALQPADLAGRQLQLQKSVGPGWYNILCLV